MPTWRKPLDLTKAVSARQPTSDGGNEYQLCLGLDLIRKTLGQRSGACNVSAQDRRRRAKVEMTPPFAAGAKSAAARQSSATWSNLPGPGTKIADAEQLFVASGRFRSGGAATPFSRSFDN